MAQCPNKLTVHLTRFMALHFFCFIVYSLQYFDLLLLLFLDTSPSIKVGMVTDSFH